MKLPAFVWYWFIPVWLLLGTARFVILVFKFRRLEKILGENMGISTASPLATPGQLATANKIRKTIAIVSRYTPWVSNCFPQAIVARLVLSIYRIPYTLNFGLRRDDRQSVLDAHAWVVTGSVDVSGGNGFQDYTVVNCYGKQSWHSFKL